MNSIVMLSLNVLAMYFAFWTIKPINFAKFMPYTPKQASFLKIILAIALGYLVASFFISITNWILVLPATVFGK
ncbi:DUF1146 family protein [Leuconostoc lactis]